MDLLILTDTAEVPVDEVVETANGLQTFFAETLPQHMDQYWHLYVIGILVVGLVVLTISMSNKKRKPRRRY